MIDERQPIWVHLYNLDVEKIQEIASFLLLSPARALWDTQELRICQEVQDTFRVTQQKLRGLVNTWLYEISPTLNIDDNSYNAIYLISNFMDELNNILMSSPQEVIIINGEVILCRPCDIMVSMDQFFNSINNEMSFDEHMQMEKELLQTIGIQEMSLVEDKIATAVSDSLSKKSLLAFIDAIIEDSQSEKPKIRKCAWDNCDNIFLKIVADKTYCSSKCRHKAKKTRENAKTQDKAAPTYQKLCDLIETWLKIGEDDEILEREGKWMTASRLQSDFKEDLNYLGLKDTEISFLSKPTANSLGKLLPNIEKKLEKENGIRLEFKKESGNTFYRISRIQS